MPSPRKGPMLCVAIRMLLYLCKNACSVVDKNKKIVIDLGIGAEEYEKDKFTLSFVITY